MCLTKTKCMSIKVICLPSRRMGLLLYMWRPSVATLTWLACCWTEDLRLTLKQGWVPNLSCEFISKRQHNVHLLLCPPHWLNTLRSNVSAVTSTKGSSLLSSPLVTADVNLSLMLLFSVRTSVASGLNSLGGHVTSVWCYFDVCQLAGQSWY